MRAKQILLVEDESEIAELLIFLLVGQGYRVEHARDGEEALKTLMDRHWDLVLTDLMMPVMNGIELVRRIRECPQLESIPVMVLSSVPEHICRAQCRPIDSFLQKPFGVKDLLSRVSSLLPV